MFFDKFLQFLYRTNENRNQCSTITYLVVLNQLMSQNSQLHHITRHDHESLPEQHIIDTAILTACVSAKGGHFEHNL